VFAELETSNACLAELVKAQGRLVLIGSVARYVSTPHASPYAMSKFAIRAFAEALRPELAPRGVTVTLISPGFVTSEIRQVDNRGGWHAVGAQASHAPRCAGELRAVRGNQKALTVRIVRTNGA
jgi:short-subunit dehydrogenase